MNICFEFKDLVQAFTLWNIDYRNGKCLTEEQVLAKSIEEDATEKAQALLVYLAKAS